VEGSAPSEAGKKGIRARDVGAPATLGVMVQHGKENLWIMVRNWTNWNIIRELLGMSWP
jgi:hypothetical protein